MFNWSRNKNLNIVAQHGIDDNKFMINCEFIVHQFEIEMWIFLLFAEYNKPFHIFKLKQSRNAIVKM